MDSQQKGQIQRLYPQASGKVFRLCEVRKTDILDPYRKPRDAFEHALTLIKQGTEAWVPRIRALH